MRWLFAPPEPNIIPRRGSTPAHTPPTSSPHRERWKIIFFRSGFPRIHRLEYLTICELPLRVTRMLFIRVVPVHPPRRSDQNAIHPMFPTLLIPQRLILARSCRFGVLLSIESSLLEGLLFLQTNLTPSKFLSIGQFRAWRIAPMLSGTFEHRMALLPAH